jgi:glycine/D-amino acid oxidase-like deaminating enzyme
LTPRSEVIVIGAGIVGLATVAQAGFAPTGGLKRADALPRCAAPLREEDAEQTGSPNTGIMAATIAIPSATQVAWTRSRGCGPRIQASYYWSSNE